jgi:glutaminase
MFEIADGSAVVQHALTGPLPSEGTVTRLVDAAYNRYRDRCGGQVADYIPPLGRVDPDLFGVALTDAAGVTDSAGDTDAVFTIQSISKAFVFALVCEESGHDQVHETVGVNNTGRSFNSVMAVELSAGSPGNPMVNAGAMATTALVPGETPDAQWEFIRAGLSRFAGRALTVDEEVVAEEMATHPRTRAPARVLERYGRITREPGPVVEVYTRQCSLSVTVTDLSVMGATLANGGVNPVTGEYVVSPEVCRDTIAVLASCGMYECSGEWMFEIGMPAKSGVSGGIVAVAPGKCAVAAYAPPLDPAGTSVRGQRVCSYLSRSLGLNLFASAAGQLGHLPELPDAT